MNKIISYPIPRGAVLQNDYKIRVRGVGENNWTELSTYRVKVDMHDVHNASMVYFDFEGEAEVEISGPWYIYQVDIRPLSKKIISSCDTKTVRFTLNTPMNLSIELNRDRYHNLHFFAGRPEKNKPNIKENNTLVVQGDLTNQNTIGAEVIKQLSEMPKGRTLYIKPGIFHIREAVMRLPSDTNVYLEGGCIIIGAFICSEVENVRIYGRGIIYQADFLRFGGINGIRLSHAQNIQIEDIIFINPPHYTIYIGGCKDVRIFNIKSFSCEGWSDGIDIMSSQNISIQGGFLRNSDDCIAIYGRRWSYNGDSTNITVSAITIWADVAHPINIGLHGDYENDGNLIENVLFEDIDILEHNEYQEGYLGCMAINAGDKNKIRNIAFQNITIEPFLHGKLFDIQVKCNPDYNPMPGKHIENILFENIQYNGYGEVTSQIKGYSDEFFVSDVTFHRVIINGKRVAAFEEANIEIGEYAYHVQLD